MKIGFDVDGVLANFIPEYQRLVVKHAGGIDLFHPGDDVDPPCWDWPEYRGYDKATTKAVFKEIGASTDFWSRLGSTADMPSLVVRYNRLLAEGHEVYFITNRVGRFVKLQTEGWLERLGIARPTVLITSRKGDSAKALGLNVYVDDNLENILDVAVESPETTAYLLDKTYNRPAAVGLETDPGGFHRIYTLASLFDREAELGRL